MSQMYYFEPLDQVLSEFRVKNTIGEVVLSWHESRQNEIGLFKAYQTSYPTNYNRFSNKVTGSTWVRYETRDGLPIFGYLDIFDTQEELQYPVYIQEWNIAPLDEAEQEALRQTAENVVATEIESRLTSVNAWASAKHIANTATPISSNVRTYINNLFALNGSEYYPFALADAAENRTYTNWPYKLSTRELYQLVDPT